MKKELTLKDLCVKHEYYCQPSNYYSNEAFSSFKTFKDFFNEMGDADLDMNLLFRWDIIDYDGGDIKMYVFIMHQRKGRYWPNQIEKITEEDLPLILEYLKPRLKHIKKLWAPLM